MYDMFPWEVSLSSLLGYNSELTPPKEELGIRDPSYDLIGQYGEPSANWSMNGPGWSALQAWDMWLHRPEPVIAILDTSLSSVLNRTSQDTKKEENKLPSFTIWDIVNQMRKDGLI